MSNVNLLQFTDLLERHGPDLTRWPEAVLPGAEALLRQSAEARELHQTMLGLEQRLLGLPDLPAADYLQAGILAELPRDPWSGVLEWFTSAFWRPALAAALPLVVGFAIGFYQGTADDQYLTEDLSLLAFTQAFEELEYDD